MPSTSRSRPDRTYSHSQPSWTCSSGVTELGSGGITTLYERTPPDPNPVTPELQVHEGWEWLYVLSGRLRLVLGTHDLRLGPGEVAEFDTRTPHALLNPGPAPVELLTLFGPQGERLHVRAQQRRSPDPAEPTT